MHTFTQSGTYPEIGDSNFKCTPWTFKQQLALKMRALCRISIVLLQTSLHCGFRDMDISYYVPWNVFSCNLCNFFAFCKKKELEIHTNYQIMIHLVRQ